MTPIKFIGATYIPVRAEKYHAGINCKLQMVGSRPTSSTNRAKLFANRAIIPLISSRFQILIDPLLKILKKKSRTEGSPRGAISGSANFFLVLLEHNIPTPLFYTFKNNLKTWNSIINLSFSKILIYISKSFPLAISNLIPFFVAILPIIWARVPAFLQIDITVSELSLGVTTTNPAPMLKVLYIS